MATPLRGWRDTHKAIANLESTTGWVTVIHADGTIVQANSGDLIYQGDVVQTGSNSAAGIRFIDGTAFNVSANSRTILDGLIPDGLLNSTAPKPIQVAMSDVSADNDLIKPFGSFGLYRLDDQSLIQMVDTPDAIVEVRRGSSGQFAITSVAADPSAQAGYYRDALQTHNLGAQYGINANSPGSGTSTDLLFIQPIKFSPHIETPPIILLSQPPLPPPLRYSPRPL